MNDSRSARSFVATHLRNVPRSGIRDFFEIVSSRKGVISLGIGEPDFVTPWHIREESIFALDAGETSYTANLGLLELRQAVSEHVEQSTGVRYDPATEILITVGVSEALDLAIRATTNPGDEVLYHEPCYVSYAPVAIFSHARPVAIATRARDAFRLRPESLQNVLSPLSRLLMLNFPTNPTGAVLQREDMEGIARIAIERDLLVVSDEIYSRLVYDTSCPGPLSIPGMRERTIYLNGFSKSCAMTGFRIGYACAPAELIEAMMKIHQYTMLCAPVLSQKAAIEALRHGETGCEEMRLEYRRRRNFIHQALNDIGLACPLPEGAFYAFPCIAELGMTSQEFSLKLLEEENVACVPGTAFGPSGEGYLRCAYATSMTNIKEAMERMQRFVDRIRKAGG